MNEHDYNNLQFLLTSSEEVIADWFLKTSADDIEYAMQIMAAASKEMSFITREINDDDCTEANELLQKFML
jgi:hypothetical protein